MSEKHPHQNRRAFLISSASAAASIYGASAFSALAELPARRAPQWDIVEWINGDAGNVDTLRGKVIVIDFFQLWCPGCNSFSGPLMTHWQEKFASQIDAGKMVLLKIHTVFEGHDYQSVERLKGYITEKNITIPVGVDRHIAGQHTPVTMRRYRTSGTPEMAVIGPDGVIRFQKFGGFDPAPVEALITQLLDPGPSRA